MSVGHLRQVDMPNGNGREALIADSTDYTGTVREVSRRLERLYPPSRLGNKEDPVDELVFIMLSGKTQESAYHETYEKLRARYPTWDEVERAGPRKIEEVIRRGGLSKKKSLAIINLLTAIRTATGAIDLSFLHERDTTAVYNFLVRLPGIGPKSARCVLSYSLQRPSFAVDAHVSRIVKRLGWSKHHRLTERVQGKIEAMVPEDCRLSLHVNLVLHGRSVCTKRDPRCHVCILADLCPSARLGPLQENKARV